MMASDHKDIRWFSWFDRSVAWDNVWHTEGMVHAFQWFTDGKSPWNLPTESSNETYSARVFAFNATCFIRNALFQND